MKDTSDSSAAITVTVAVHLSPAAGAIIKRPRVLYTVVTILLEATRHKAAVHSDVVSILRNIIGASVSEPGYNINYGFYIGLLR